MNAYAILSALFPFGMGLILLLYSLKNWSNPNKQDVKYSELIESFLFFVMGYYILILIKEPPEIETKFYGIMFWIYFAIAFFFLGLNVVPNIIKARVNPEYRKEETYEKFLNYLKTIYSSEQEAEKADKIKDLSRKVLHILQFSAYLFLHFYAIDHAERIAESGLSPIEFRNFILFFIGGFFWIMMMVGDMTRLINWRYLPKWAWKWYEKSLEPTREIWTLNAATPILLANFVFLHPAIPVQVFFTAAYVSCIGDALASIIGKNFGKHKLGNVGKYPDKTWEGLAGGTFFTFLGVFIIMVLVPVEGVADPLLLASAAGLISALIFALVDLYCTKIADNITNSLLPGFAVWVLIALF